MKKELLFVGLDVPAKNITIALAEGARKDSVHAAGGGGEARLYGTIPNDLHALEKVFSPSFPNSVWERGKRGKTDPAVRTAGGSG